jgi:hypothetical protein
VKGGGEEMTDDMHKECVEEWEKWRTEQQLESLIRRSKTLIIWDCTDEELEEKK